MFLGWWCICCIPHGLLCVSDELRSSVIFSDNHRPRVTKTIPFVYIPLRINQRRETNADRVRPSGGQYPRDPSRQWGERRRNKIYGEKLETAAERRATTNGEARVGGRLTHTTYHHLELGQKKLQPASAPRRCILAAAAGNNNFQLRAADIANTRRIDFII